MDDCLMECRNVAFGYTQTRVLDGISLTINRGDFVGVIGPNGAGKSTLLKILSGVIRPAEGGVLLGGVDIGTLHRRTVALQLAFVRQEDTSDFGFSAKEHVMMGRAPHHGGLHFEDKYDCSVVDLAMAVTRVDHLADRRLEDLSGGERQRVRIARALSQEPKVLFLDEPTTYLDLYSQLALIELMREVNAEGISILAVSHDINFIAESCRHVKLLNNGRFYAEGRPDEVITEDALAECFRIRALVDTNPVTSSPRMTPLARIACDTRQFSKR
ncbi:MAG: ABC transporter ATP-binding protein [Pseudomonadota bacterium]